MNALEDISPSWHQHDARKRHRLFPKSDQTDHSEQRRVSVVQTQQRVPTFKIHMGLNTMFTLHNISITKLTWKEENYLDVHI